MQGKDHVHVNYKFDKYTDSHVHWRLSTVVT